MTSKTTGQFWKSWGTGNKGNNVNTGSSNLDAKIDSAIQDLLSQPQSKEYIKQKIMGKANPSLNLNTYTTAPGNLTMHTTPNSNSEVNQQIKLALAQLLAQQNQQPVTTSTVIQKPTIATSTVQQPATVIKTIEHPSTDVYYDVAPQVYYPASSTVHTTPARSYYTPKTPGRSRVVSYAPSTTVGRSYVYDGYHPTASYVGNSYATPYYSYYPTRAGYGKYHDDYDYDYGYGDYYGDRYGKLSRYGDYSTRSRRKNRYADDYDYGYGLDYDYDKDYKRGSLRRSSLRRSRYR